MGGHTDTAMLLLGIILGCTLWRTFLVVDAIRGQSGLVARSARRISSTAALAQSRPPTQQRLAAGAGGTSRVIRFWLVSMHVAAVLGQAAGILKYAIPVSDISCRITARAMVALVLLYDAALVAFFLAKVVVTNGNRPVAGWEKGLIWGTRFYAWIVMPLGAIFMAFAYPVSANDEEEICFSDYRANGILYARIYVANNFLLILQFFCLLGLFLKPMLGLGQVNSQSGGALYKRVVIRNVVSTASISAAYIVATVVVVAAFGDDSPENNNSAIVTDVTRSTKRLLTLCLTEISLPLGCTSCWRECSAGFRSRESNIVQTRRAVRVRVAFAKLGVGKAGPVTTVQVLPVQEPLPLL